MHGSTNERMKRLITYAKTIFARWEKSVETPNDDDVNIKVISVNWPSMSWPGSPVYQQWLAETPENCQISDKQGIHIYIFDFLELCLFLELLSLFCSVMISSPQKHEMIKLSNPNFELTLKCLEKAHADP